MIPKIIRALFRTSSLVIIAANASCSAFPPVQTIDQSMPAILSVYSSDLSTGTLSNRSIYSREMRALVEERRLFYARFFLNALHSDLIALSSRFEIRSISEEAERRNAFSVKAAELIEATAKYRLEPNGDPLVQAAAWAIQHTDDPRVKKELQSFASMRQAAAYKNSTEGYETGFVLEHTFLVIQTWNGFRIIEDAYTDANPQDNPAGTDVIEWRQGAFLRKEVDYSNYPDYSIYHSSIEELGQTLLEDYSK